MADLYPIYKGKNQISPKFYIMIEETHYPSMCPEFDPGPPEDEPFPEYWNCQVEAFIVDTESGKVSMVSPSTMRTCYKYISGRRERIAYWHALRYLEHQLKVIRDKRKSDEKIREKQKSDM